MKRFVLYGFLLLAALPAWADIDVRIVDYPSQVLLYSPILVTVRVANQGSTPLLIPASNGTSNGYFVEYGPGPESLSTYRPILTKGASSVVWLKPGSSWLFQVDLGRFWIHEPGRIFVAGGVASTGKCQHVATGTETFPLRVVHETAVSKWYECWSGHVSSSVVSIDIVEPNTTIDREALDYYESPSFVSMRGYPNLGVWAGYHLLLERFPTSQLTYVVGFHACDENASCLQQLLDLQPSHPLSPYTRLQLSLALLGSGRSAEVTASFVEGLGLPDGLEQYLLQRRQEAGQTQGAANGPASERR